MTEKMTYAGVGVDYSSMDPFKRMAQEAGRQTASNISRINTGEFREVEMSRGESVYLIETEESYLAHVEEGLGTKNLVADEMHRLTGKTYYDYIAQDTVAMIVNDMVTLGALPLSTAMHLAVGDSRWFEDEARRSALVRGWKEACDLARCTWGGGETPTLKDVLLPGAVVLSGSAMGIIKPKGKLISSANIRNGDAIVLLQSSGIHANGLTLARTIAEKLPEGYLTKLNDGRSYGEALLAPTHIYVGAVEDCINAGIDIHYAVNITGHGWRKLMRANEPFAYIIKKIPMPGSLFDFIQEHGPMDDREAYGNLNMGAGFALYVSQEDVEKVYELVGGWTPKYGFRAMDAGYVEKSSEKKVIIEPKNLEYVGSTLGVR